MKLKHFIIFAGLLLLHTTDLHCSDSYEKLRRAAKKFNENLYAATLLYDRINKNTTISINSPIVRDYGHFRSLAKTSLQEISLILQNMPTEMQKDFNISAWKNKRISFFIKQVYGAKQFKNPQEIEEFYRHDSFASKERINKWQKINNPTYKKKAKFTQSLHASTLTRCKSATKQPFAANVLVAKANVIFDPAPYDKQSQF